jgi:hypothetical protein
MAKRQTAAQRKASRQQAVAEAAGTAATPVVGEATARAAAPPIPVEKNPPDQPVIPPAKQIHSPVQGYVDPEALDEAKPIDPATAIRVQATGLVYYDNVLRRVGDVFDIRNEKEMSKAMRRVSRATPARTTTPNQALAREKAGDEPNAEAAVGTARAADADVLS